MKRPIPFKFQVRDAHKAIADVFGNTNVSRSATRNALQELRESLNEYIFALDQDEQDGVKDESISL